MIKSVFPGATARRSLQSERAYESDVVVEGDCPSVLKETWWECGNRKQINPEEKLEQAEHDAAEALARTGQRKHAVVVWQRKGERTTKLTTRLGTLLLMTGVAVPPPPVAPAAAAAAVVVTVKLCDVLKAIKEASK